MENLKLDRLRVTGDISVEPVTRIDSEAVVYIIMGPTGAGKSTFIEGLAGVSQNLAISNNQLAGFTQHVSAYKLVNVARVLYGREIYLVDTPGFSDGKISEMEVLEMLKDWLKEYCSPSYFRILFLTPITVTRLPGSRQRTIKMLKESLGGNPVAVTVTTTMWDTLHSERTWIRAEKTFEQLRDEVFKGFFGKTTNLERFTGTGTSALQVMDDGAWHGRLFEMSTHTPSVHLYCDLHERIEGALQKKVMLEADLAHSDAQANKQLKDILERDQKENDEMLAKFISQLVKFGQPPHEFREAAQALRKNIAAKIVPKGLKMWLIFRQWAREPEIRSGPGFDTQPLDTGLMEEPVPSHSRNIDLKGLLGHLVDVANTHRPKWPKREE